MECLALCMRELKTTRTVKVFYTPPNPSTLAPALDIALGLWLFVSKYRFSQYWSMVSDMKGLTWQDPHI